MLPNMHPARGLSAIRSILRQAKLDLNFTQNEVLDPRITFSRTSNATRTNAQGLIETVAVNQPRFDYDPITLASKGLLIEESRTNLLTYSEQFDNAAWAKTNATVTANTITAPDGQTTADYLMESATTASHVIRQTNPVTNGSIVNLSVYLKAGARTWAGLIYYDEVSNIQGYSVNLSNGTFGTQYTGSNVLAKDIQNVGNGWYRVSIAVLATSTNCRFNVYTLSADNTYSYIGDGTSGIYIWGAQVEAGSFPTSYIPTISAQVTRAADNASMVGTNFSSWYNQSEGTIYSEWVLGNDIISSQVYNINDGTSSNYIRNRYNSAGTAGDNAVVVSDVAQAILESTNQITTNSTYKNAMAYKQNDFARSSSGTLITDNLGNLPTVNQLNLGAAILPTGYLNGHIKLFKFFSKRFINTYLQRLTQ